MMELRHARLHPLRPTFSLCDGPSQSRVVAPERILGIGKPHSEGTPPDSFAAVGWGEVDTGGDRQTAGRKALKELARTAKPDTILGWYQRLIARKFDGSQYRAYPGRPRVAPAVEALVVRFARENTSWGYDRIVVALANLGHHLSDQTVGNILRRHDITPAPTRSRSTTWKEFIRSHMDVLAGADFFTAEVLTWRGLMTYYVLFFIELKSRRVWIGGITRHPDSCWMQQVGRNATLERAKAI